MRHITAARIDASRSILFGASQTRTVRLSLSLQRLHARTTVADENKLDPVSPSYHACFLQLRRHATQPTDTGTPLDAEVEYLFGGDASVGRDTAAAPRPGRPRPTQYGLAADVGQFC